MNSTTVTQVGWDPGDLVSAVPWIDPIFYLLGLTIAVWAFRRSRKGGYLVFALYFAFCAFWLFAGASINRAIHSRNQPDLSSETQKQLEAAVREATDRVVAQAGQPTVTGVHTLNLNLMPIAIALGLWLLARREPVVTRPSRSGDAKPPFQDALK